MRVGEEYMRAEYMYIYETYNKTDLYIYESRRIIYESRLVIYERAQTRFYMRRSYNI